MTGIPDYTLGDTVDFKFTTRRFSSGAPFTLAGTPVVSAYPDNSTTQITAGITLSVDFDTVTGLNNVRVVATSGNGYASGSTYHLVITTGTVDSVSVVGEVIGAFSLGRSAAAADLANATDGLGAIKGDTAAILLDTGTDGVVLANNAISSSKVATNAFSNSVFTTGYFNAINAEADTALSDYDPPTNTEMAAAFTEIKGATWATTDTLEAIRDRGDAAWITATGFSTHSAADVWSVSTRVLTANTNLNDPTAAAIADAVHDEVIEGTTTFRQSARGYNAVLLGKASGLATTSAVYRDIGDTKDRITATVDADGNRTAVTRDLT